ncbi:Fic family protein [Arsenicicoccus piscis]|uniref:Fic family protein n=1 Tax=Arsenicicoccus piscis TaxID=673954 RepID=A0ABQ6HM93_9MICO|nr:Fic family protein [Arsenicicoccus piscis]GMA19521.1 Fic family protein [Arsenicicoccus piscis]
MTLGRRDSDWPGLTYEAVAWDVHPVSGMTRRDRARVGTPYQAAVPPSIGQLEVRPSGPVAAEAEEAAAAVRVFDAEVGRDVAPYAAVLLRTESAASSQIEQLSASARKIAEAEVYGRGSAHAEQIVANVHAMSAALGLADRLDAEAILAMHDVLMRGSDPDIAGRWRADQVWVGGRVALGAGSPHDADFVPPVAGRVPGAIDDLVRFARRDDIAVLPQVAVAHAQFETIHPFADGNGRTGRALLQAMLRSKELTRQVSVPVSSGLLTSTRGYFDALTAYRAGDLDPIVSCVSRAALIGVDNGRRLVRDLHDVRAGWDDRLAGVRSDSAARRLADELVRQPVISAPMARRLLGIDNNEHRHIDVLVSRGILTSHQDYVSRNRTWRAQDVLDVLDAYAARAGRRGR